MEKQQNLPISGTDCLLNGQNNREAVGPDRHTVSDDVLVSRCKNGNMGAFATLIQRHQQRLFNALLRMVSDRDDAQDLTQEAFVRALKGIKRFRGQAGFYTWLFRIGFNLAIDHCKKQRPVAFSVLDQDDRSSPSQASALHAMVDERSASPVQQAQVREMHQKVLQGLTELDEQMRAAVILRDIEQLSYAQISQILEIPSGTVKSRIARGRMQLRERLTQDGQQG